MNLQLAGSPQAFARVTGRTSLGAPLKDWREEWPRPARVDTPVPKYRMNEIYGGGPRFARFLFMVYQSKAGPPLKTGLRTSHKSGLQIDTQFLLFQLQIRVGAQARQMICMIAEGAILDSFLIVAGLYCVTARPKKWGG